MENRYSEIKCSARKIAYKFGKNAVCKKKICTKICIKFFDNDQLSAKIFTRICKMQRFSQLLPKKVLATYMNADL